MTISYSSGLPCAIETLRASGDDTRLLSNSHLLEIAAGRLSSADNHKVQRPAKNPLSIVGYAEDGASRKVFPNKTLRSQKPEMLFVKKTSAMLPYLVAIAIALGV